MAVKIHGNKTDMFRFAEDMAIFTDLEDSLNNIMKTMNSKKNNKQNRTGKVFILQNEKSIYFITISKLIKSYVCSVLLYGSETWTIEKVKKKRSFA